ncbi:unnamed protein product [Clonostachys rosea]|uniref:Uncharacterized protein n=1 Tax=Bionectria ochroleuca TaxID=29856 RepID=A0ABY6U0K4_BIOOC|nr:unnamed protein product [Clonostachys rosea]
MPDLAPIFVGSSCSNENALGGGSGDTEQDRERVHAYAIMYTNPGKDHATENEHGHDVRVDGPSKLVGYEAGDRSRRNANRIGDEE